MDGCARYLAFVGRPELLGLRAMLVEALVKFINHASAIFRFPQMFNPACQLDDI
jgi:hypothetical protein